MYAARRRRLDDDFIASSALCAGICLSVTQESRIGGERHTRLSSAELPQGIACEEAFTIGKLELEKKKRRKEEKRAVRCKVCINLRGIAVCGVVCSVWCGVVLSHVVDVEN